MSEEDKDYTSENKRRMLVALAIMLGASIEASPDSWKEVPKEIQKQAKLYYEERGLSRIAELPTRLPEREVQIAVADIGNSVDVKLYKIVGTLDNRTCPDCAEWQGRTVTMSPDGKHHTVDEFINQHGFHPNCRCSLQPLDVSEILLKEPNPRIDIRKAANPRIYNNCASSKGRVVFL